MTFLKGVLGAQQSSWFALCKDSLKNLGSIPVLTVKASLHVNVLLVMCNGTFGLFS